MNQYIQLTFRNIGLAEQEIIIAQLSELNFEAFEEKDDALIACVSFNLFDEDKIKDHIKFPYQKNIIEQKNWNEEWERSFEPVIVNDFCAIRASFHPAVHGVKHEIIITPKMSFGTGHHPTTFMMIQLMGNININGKSVLDFGTGTSVLAILAEKLGAATIVAIDNDEWSIRNAQENIEMNHCNCIMLKKADSLNMDTRFDIIFANINKHIILINLSDIKQHLRKDGVLLLSGILSSDEDDIRNAAFMNNLGLVEKLQHENWIALRLKHL